MRKQKRIYIITVLVIFILSLAINYNVFASSKKNSFEEAKYTEEFLEWLKLPEEERKKVMQPRMFEIPYTSQETKNPILKIRKMQARVNQRYSLKDVIPNNLVIRNQRDTSSCWAFAGLSSFETNLAIQNYKKGINQSKVYDFSERHMEYATSRVFANGAINEKGYNREVNSGGNWVEVHTYLTNGQGPIKESDMPFENNGNQINISQIQNKEVVGQLYDTVEFADYQSKTGSERTEIMDQIKEHIQNYGSVFATIHGDSTSTGATCYNNDTGAIYCNNAETHKIDHAVSIIGWDDNYNVNNFSSSSRPVENGAWIIRNSWGEEARYTFSELKKQVFEANRDGCIANGWNSPEEIPDERIKIAAEQNGFTVENNEAYKKMGDNGIMYVSYEDVNISTALHGITKAKDTVNYENIYQYDDYYRTKAIYLNDTNEFMLCNVFDKKTTGKEYLNQLSIYVLQNSTCKVYVNPDGKGTMKRGMKQITLKTGETQTITPGYHTLEFASPVEIKGDQFAVLIEIKVEERPMIAIEAPYSEIPKFSAVKVEKDKCFVASGTETDVGVWSDLGRLSEENSSLPNGDSTIKAFTSSEILDDSLKNIVITTPPTKTTYFEGEDFNKGGMVVTANYNNKTSEELDDSSYSIENGTNLLYGQTSVIIHYQDKTVNQPITVEKNTVTELEITNPPAKTEYKEGQNFDKTGMTVQATYKDGTKKTVTDYTIENSYNLKDGQTVVTIKYGERTVDQTITVLPNPLIELKITKEPNKTDYIVGQNFDKTGMVVTGTYQDNSKNEIIDYTIENGTNLRVGQTAVTIKYGEKTVNQTITVEEKSIIEIDVEKKPNKLTYLQNKEELDLSGGKLKIKYNDGTTESVEMTSKEVTASGFKNDKLGKITITVTYQTKTAKFDVEIIEEVKPKNSDLSKAKGKITKAKAYFFTNAKEEPYILANIEIDGISRNTENDTLEYYYYISSNPNEDNITKWVKVTEKQDSLDKIKLMIDSRNLANDDGEDLYLYIKEVAIKGGNQNIVQTKAMKIEEDDADVELYLDNTLVKDIGQTIKPNVTPNGSGDTTVIKGSLPQTGIKITLTLVAVITVGIGIFLYIRYKKYKV